jgi:hypothetical protein
MSRPTTTEGGGGVGEEGGENQGEEVRQARGGEVEGGEGGKRMCCMLLKHLLSEKNYRPLHLNPTHISIGRLQLLLHL